MTNLITRDQAIKQEMDKKTTKRQVDRYLAHLVFWTQGGYEFTEEQEDALRVLWELKGTDA